MNVFVHELRMMRRAGVWWLIGLLGTALLFLSIYPSFTQDIEASRRVLASFPPEMRAAIGLSIDSFFSFFGFYAYIFTYVSLAAAVYGCYCGLTIISKEEMNKTTDFLFAKPISRQSIFVAKLAATSVTVLGVGVLLQLGTYGCAQLFGIAAIDFGTFVLFSGSMLLVMAWFMAVGILISIVFPRIKSIVTIAIAVPFGFLIIGMIGTVIGEDVVRYLTPFKYVDYQYVAQHHAYEPAYILVGLGGIVACLVVSFVVYSRRDTRAVA